MSAAATTSPADTAEAWFRQQLAASRQQMGAAWPAHREWVADYLRHETRERFQLQPLDQCPGAAR